MTTPKILRWLPDFEGHDFRDVNFRTGLPHYLTRSRTVVKGEIVRINYYAEAPVLQGGVLVYNDLVIREDINYTRDAGTLVVYRDTILTWINEDETDNESIKTRRKFYTPVEQFAEAKKRRKLVIDELEIELIALLMMAAGKSQEESIVLGKQFATTHQTAIAAYTGAAADHVLVDAIAQDTDLTWLNTPISPTATIRHYLLGEITL